MNQRRLIYNYKRDILAKKLLNLNITISDLDSRITQTNQKLGELEESLIDDQSKITLYSDALEQQNILLASNQTWFRQEIEYFEGNISIAAVILDNYAKGKPDLDLSKQNLIVTMELQDDKLQSLFDQLLNYISEVNKFEATLNDYTIARGLLLERNDYLNNLLKRTPSTGQIKGSKYIYPFFGNCTPGQPDNCVCNSLYSNPSLSCSVCADTNKMNLYYTPTSDSLSPPSCQIDQRSIQANIVQSGDSSIVFPSALVSNAYLPKLTITFSVLNQGARVFVKYFFFLKRFFFFTFFQAFFEWISSFDP